MVQWLRLGHSVPWTQVRSLVGELRSHKLHGAAKKKKLSSEKHSYIAFNCIYLREVQTLKNHQPSISYARQKITSFHIMYKAIG